MTKCIVADDSRVVRGVIVKILSNLGFEVLEAETGEEVLDLYTKNKDIDLLIMDYRLPVLEGIEVLYKIREAPKEEGRKRAFIILSSSIILEQNIRDALEYGADDYLMKPFDEDILSSKLEILGLI